MGVPPGFIISIFWSSMRCIVPIAASTVCGSRSRTACAFPILAPLLATRTSVAVRTSPPKTKPSVTSLWPTDCGPMVSPFSDTRLPPPRPSANMSGIRKFVRTPPILITLLDARGNPPFKTPISDVVPPISTTIASSSPVNLNAPRREFVGPEANVRAG